MENGNHNPAMPNGELKSPDASGDKASFSPRPGAPESSPNLASLLSPELINADGISDTGSRRSSMQPRVPSRQLLQTALDLAQKAVEMDKGNDVAGALAAYREAVTKLRVVMERVGVDPMDPKRTGKNEDEGRTLRGIHDAYMARITLLSAYEGGENEEAVSAGIGAIMMDDTTNGPLSTPPIPPPMQINTGITDAGSVNGDAGPSTPLRSPTASSSMSRRKRRIASKQSFGLDEEADLTGVDGVAEGDESSLNDTARSERSLSRTLPPVGEDSPRNSIGSESDRPLPPLPERSNHSDLLSTPQSSLGRRRPQHRSTTQTSMSSISELNGSPHGSFSQETGRMRTTSMRGYTNGGLGEFAIPPVPPLQAAFKSTLAPPIRLQGNAHLAGRPEPQPVEAIHRPFHLLRLLYASMDPTKPGVYITSTMHVDAAMWKPAGWRTNYNKPSTLRLGGQDAKARVCAALIGHLEGIKAAGGPLLDGAREGQYGGNGSGRLGKGEIDQAARVGDAVATLLDALDDELDLTHKALQSKGVAVGPWKGKSKSSWGSRLSARVDKMSRGGDSPDRYVDLLGQLFLSLQVIDEHLRSFTGPCTPAYHSLPLKTYKQIETRLTRVAQFVGIVIVPFVLDDLRQLLMAYFKGGVKYLEE